jgi:hypothetical protein
MGPSQGRICSFRFLKVVDNVDLGSFGFNRLRRQKEKESRAFTSEIKHISCGDSR